MPKSQLNTPFIKLSYGSSVHPTLSFLTLLEATPAPAAIYGESRMLRRASCHILLLVLLCSWCLAVSDAAAEMVKLKGSGASFPFPLYGRWFKDYGKVNRQVQVDYQAKGSGAGIKDFVNKTVDFAASDAAMTDEEIASVDVGVQLLPMTAGTIVLAYNLPNGPKD